MRPSILGLAAVVGMTNVAMCQWTFSLVANSSTQVPSGTGNFTTFSPPALANGNVLFVANQNAGIYTNVFGPLSRVADQTSLLPGQPINFSGFGSPTLDGATPVFTGGNGLVGGIYSGVAPTLSIAADTSTAIPNTSSTFAHFANAVSKGGSVGFVGGSDLGTGVGYPGAYVKYQGQLSTLADSTTPIPGGGTFAGFQSVAIGSQSAYFVGSSASGSGHTGIYSRPLAGGALNTIVSPTTPAPGGGTFTGLGNVRADHENLAFVGGTTNTLGAYAYLDGSLISLADRSTTAPDGGLFTSFPGPISISGRNIVFLATTTVSSFGLYVWRNGEISRLIVEGDILGGQAVRNPSLSAQAIEGDTVAFSVTYGLVTQTGAVYTATIPAPGGAAALVAAGVLAGRRRRVDSAHRPEAYATCSNPFGFEGIP